MAYKLTILVDFDGVLHSYTSGWKGADVVSDPPVEGALEWLEEALLDPTLDVQVYSSRSCQDGGAKAMWDWLHYHFFQKGLNVIALDDLKFPTEKPPAFLTIDDRAIRFTGVFPSRQDIKDFKPWYKR